MEKLIEDTLKTEISKLEIQEKQLRNIKSATENESEIIRLGGKIEGVRLAIENLRQTLSLWKN